MPKTKEQKEKIVKDLEDRFSKIKMAILTDFSGLKTKEISELRDKLGEKGIDYKVVKNTLLNLALASSKIEIPDEILEKPIAIAFGYKEEIEPCKIIFNFAKEHENLEILGGIEKNNFIDVEKIKSLAILPSHEELYARLIGSLNSPKFRLLNVLSQNQRKLIYILNQYLRNSGG